MPRVIGGCLSYLVFGGVLVLLGLLVVPTISGQSAELIDQFPSLVERATSRVVEVAENLQLPIGVDSVESITESVQEWFADPSNRDVILEGLGQVGEIALGVIEVLVIFLLAPVLAFYILVDAPNLMSSAERLVPESSRRELVHVGRQVARAVGGFVRGQLVVALIVGVLSSLVLLVLNLPFWLIVGLTAGLLNIIPFIGPWVGGLLGLTTALIEGDAGKAVWVVVAFLAIQQLDNHIVSPLILRVAVRLNPATIILSLLAGGSIGGLFGVLIAVPLTAALKIVIGHLWRTRIVGESWDEAAEAMLVEFDVEPLKERFRRSAPVDEAESARARDGTHVVVIDSAIDDVGSPDDASDNTDEDDRPNPAP